VAVALQTTVHAWRQERRLSEIRASNGIKARTHWQPNNAPATPFASDQNPKRLSPRFWASSVWGISTGRKAPRQRPLPHAKPFSRSWRPHTSCSLCCRLGKIQPDSVAKREFPSKCSYASLQPLVSMPFYPLVALKQSLITARYKRPCVVALRVQPCNVQNDRENCTLRKSWNGLA
jgi:hypothetical protein